MPGFALVGELNSCGLVAGQTVVGLPQSSQSAVAIRPEAEVFIAHQSYHLCVHYRHPVIPGLYSKAVIHISYGYPLRFRRDRPRRLLKRGVSVGAVDALGNRARKRRAMSPTEPLKVIAESMTAAAVRR